MKSLAIKYKLATQEEDAPATEVVLPDTFLIRAGDHAFCVSNIEKVALVNDAPKPKKRTKAKPKPPAKSARKPSGRAS